MRLNEITIIPNFSERDYDGFSPSWKNAERVVVRVQNKLEYRHIQHDSKDIIECTDNGKYVGYLILMFRDGYHNVVMVSVNPTYRGQNIATTLYEIAIIDLNMTVLSDFEQTVGGNKIWKKLATNPKIKVTPHNNRLIATSV